MKMKKDIPFPNEGDTYVCNATGAEIKIIYVNEPPTYISPENLDEWQITYQFILHRQPGEFDEPNDVNVHRESDIGNYTPEFCYWKRDEHGWMSEGYMECKPWKNVRTILENNYYFKKSRCVKVKKTVKKVDGRGISMVDNVGNNNDYRSRLTSIFDLEDGWEDKIIEMGDALYSNGEEKLSEDLNDLLHDVYTDHDWEFAADVVNSIAQECESSEARRIGLELADDIRQSI